MPPSTGSIGRAMKRKPRPENVMGGPADGGWQDAPEGTCALPVAWTIEAMNPYFVHVYVYDESRGRWMYHGVAMEASLGDWEPEGGE